MFVEGNYIFFEEKKIGKGGKKKIVEEISDIYAALKLQSKAESSFSSD